MNRKFLLLCSPLLLVLIFLGCNVTSEVSNPDAYFIVTNLSPDAPGLDINVDDSLYFKNLVYPSSTPFYKVASGNYICNAFATGTSNQLINVTPSFSPAGAYSIFVIDSANAISTAVLGDYLPPLTGDVAGIRILDFAPIGETVNIASAGSSPATITSSGRYFNDEATTLSYATYMTVPAGQYSFNVVSQGSSIALPLLGTSSSQLLASGNYYTLVLSGFLNGAANAQSLRLTAIPNNLPK